MHTKCELSEIGFLNIFLDLRTNVIKKLEKKIKSLFQSYIFTEIINYNEVHSSRYLNLYLIKSERRIALQ